MLGPQQTVHHPFVRVFGAIGQKRGHLFGRRRQPGQVKTDTAQQGVLVRLRRGAQSFPFQTGQDEVVNLVSRPCLAVDRGRLGTLECSERPMSFPFRALIDPAANRFDFLLGRLAIEARGRHPRGRLPVADALVETAGSGVTWNDNLISRSRCQRINYDR